MRDLLLDSQGRRVPHARFLSVGLFRLSREGPAVALASVGGTPCCARATLTKEKRRTEGEERSGATTKSEYSANYTRCIAHRLRVTNPSISSPVINSAIVPGSGVSVVREIGETTLPQGPLGFELAPHDAINIR